MTTEKGQAFEEKVAKWAKRNFKLDKVERNKLFKGKTTVRPFEIDIVGSKKATSLLTYPEVFWIECKDRKGTIKRTDIEKFKNSAIEVKKAVPSLTWSGLSKEQVMMNWSHLIFVSTSSFDADALNVAAKNKIACYYYDGKTYKESVA